MTDINEAIQEMYQKSMQLQSLLYGDPGRAGGNVPCPRHIDPAVGGRLQIPLVGKARIVRRELRARDAIGHCVFDFGVGCQAPRDCLRISGSHARG